LKNFFDSLKISKLIIGENNPSIATTYSNIGSVYCSQRDHIKALEMYNKCLEIRK